ncbi:MAG: gamma-glutamylcyclotransferase family protein [Limnobacter sp.]|nr:gamma-glutamylcyclotransferase family protein [Limnobacter sp.]
MTGNEVEKQVNVFVYGSLMFHQVWSSVVTGQYLTTNAVLEGHRRHRVEGETYPAAMPSAVHQIEGIVYKNVSPADVKRLDLFEGPEYHREAADVLIETGEKLPAQFYRWLLPEKAIDDDWSVEYFRNVGLELFLNSYVANARKAGRAK